MKRIGTNKEVTLTESVAKFWLSHQANQRDPIQRHVHALAKLFKRTGWRNDQRICVTIDNHLLNGLQRLSAIVSMGDYGWKIPVTVFDDEEITNDLVESLNVQKNDPPARLMNRLYGWKDRRMTNVASEIYRCISDRSNPTAHDLFDIYEHLKNHIDEVLKVTESKKRGDSSIASPMMVAAVCCSLDGLSLDRYLQTSNDFLMHNESGSVWSALRDWERYWRSLKCGNGENVQREPYELLGRVAIRFKLISNFIKGKRVPKIACIDPEERNELCSKCRELLKNAAEF